MQEQISAADTLLKLSIAIAEELKTLPPLALLRANFRVRAAAKPFCHTLRWSVSNREKEL